MDIYGLIGIAAMGSFGLISLVAALSTPRSMYGSRPWWRIGGGDR